MVTQTVTSGRLNGSSGNDTLTGITQNGYGQIHAYAGAGDDTINIDFAGNHNGFSAGLHARGDSDGSNNRGSDTFAFINTSRVSAGEISVGRIEDFDGRDRITVDGAVVDLNNLPGNIRVVEYNGAHNDAGAVAQQWLLITTATGGHIFYALEGARIDMDQNGGSNSNNMENHFIRQDQGHVPNFANLTDVDYVDTQNYVPAGVTAGPGGLTINDDDENAADVLAQINGSAFNDVIAAGLNDDTVRAGSGNDQIWGGSGNDVINGDNGNDIIYGGTGNDRLTGGRGNDDVYGGRHNDVINGWGGNDDLFGQHGNDRIYAQQGNDLLDGGEGNDRLFGSTGNDTLRGGSGNDHLNGGADRDSATGGSGADVFEFKTGDLEDWGDLSGNWAQKNAQLDVINDFQIGVDKIEFDNFANVSSRADLKAWKTTIDGDVHYTVKVRATNERILVNVEDDVSWSQFFNDGNFLFT